MIAAVRAQGWASWLIGKIAPSARRRAALVLAAACAVGGCTRSPRILLPDEQRIIDRQLVEYPAGYELRRYVTDFLAPTAMAFMADGTMLVATSEPDKEPVIWQIAPGAAKPTKFYPREQQFLNIPLPRTGWRMFGPIGGMVVVDGNVIVTHRDENGLGVVTSLDPKGGHKTLCAGFPCQGDYGLTDIAYDSRTGRVWFGCGTVTNSGVVGLDNWAIGWVRQHPEAHDLPLKDIELLGYKFQTFNPIAGLFGPADIAVTAPFQAFNQSFSIRVKASPDGKPSGAIYSVPATGGFANVEAYGVHLPRGIAFNEFGSPYITNNGMEMRGTRPIKDDPDSLIHLPPGLVWLGWPDYSAIFEPISEARYQPPESLVVQSGYGQIRAIIDQKASGLTPPVRDSLLETAFPSLSGAAKLAFTPTGGAFGKDFAGSVIVALSGDRTPFASGGVTLPRPVGFKVVRVDLDRHTARDFVRNVGDLPGSKIDERNRSFIERPIDIKFGPDGAMYILDEGQMVMKHGREQFNSKFTGQIYRLVPVEKPTTQPQ